MQNTAETFAKYAVGNINPKKYPDPGCSLVVGQPLHEENKYLKFFFLPKTFKYLNKKKCIHFFQTVENYTKDAECTELREKSNFRFFRFLFFEL